jgi:hypothetical protein
LAAQVFDCPADDFKAADRLAIDVALGSRTPAGGNRGRAGNADRIARANAAREAENGFEV